jgi:hypothetical protein
MAKCPEKWLNVCWNSDSRDKSYSTSTLQAKVFHPISISRTDTQMGSLAYLCLGDVPWLFCATGKDTTSTSERTVYALTGEARWEWGHEIEGREEDLVRGKGVDEVETRLRSTRVSVTFRWMKDGADVLA